MGLSFDQNPEEREKLKEIQMQKIDDFEERGRQILEFLGESLCLKKYAKD